MSYGLGYIPSIGIGAALPISLTINSAYQVVGGKPTYRIANATPGATVYWSSYKNGQQTGESRAAYGQVIEANGSLEIEGSGPWQKEDVGSWLKEVEIEGQRAAVTFSVNEAANVIDGGALPSGGFLSNPLFYVGDYAITPGIVVGALLGIYALKSLGILKR